MVTVNTTIVAGITWVIGILLKQVKWIENDRLPQILYMVSLVATYLLEVVKGLGVTPAPVEPAVYQPAQAEMAMDPLAGGSTSWILATIWDWIGRKLILEKVFKKK